MTENSSETHKKIVSLMKSTFIAILHMTVSMKFLLMTTSSTTKVNMRWPIYVFLYILIMKGKFKRISSNGATTSSLKTLNTKETLTFRNGNSGPGFVTGTKMWLG